MSALQPAVHRTVVCVDVAGFNARRRTTAHQVAIRDGVYRSLESAFAQSEVSWKDCDVEDRGDGVVVLVPSAVPKGVLASRVPRRLAAALADHNQSHDDQAQIRLRMAMHAGEVQYDRHGVTGNAVTLTFRLLEAAPLRRALDDSSGVLAVITSQWFYEEVIANTPACEPATYRRVPVAVKETRTTAWICRPDVPYPPHRDAVAPAGDGAASQPANRPFPAVVGAEVGADPGTNPAAAGPAPTRPTHASPGRRVAGPTTARKVLGARLRRLRTERGMTRADAASAIGASESKIRRIEAGRGGCKPHDVADLLASYGVMDETLRADSLALAAQTRMPGWMHTYADVLPGNIKECLELEQTASLIRGYEPHLIPRLLQTPDYARAMLLRNPDIPASHIERWVDALTACQQILHQPEPPQLWMIFDEEALRSGRDVDAATVRRQLRHLLDLAEQRHVTLQVMRPGACVATGGAFTILRLPARDLRHVVCLEQLTNTVYLDDPGDIDHYQALMHRLVVHAAEPSETITILRGRLEAT